MRSSAAMWRHAVHDIVDLWEPAHNEAPAARGRGGELDEWWR
jgi:hypothetical protein